MGLQMMPKYWKKAVYGQLRAHMGEIIRELARQKERRWRKGVLSLMRSLVGYLIIFSAW